MPFYYILLVILSPSLVILLLSLRNIYNLMSLFFLFLLRNFSFLLFSPLKKLLYRVILHFLNRFYYFLNWFHNIFRWLLNFIYLSHLFLHWLYDNFLLYLRWWINLLRFFNFHKVVNHLPSMSNRSGWFIS